MSSQYKYQEQFAHELYESWLNGNKEHVRLTIRGLKNKAQAAYIAAAVCAFLASDDANGGLSAACAFNAFIHPNNR